jgi:hypothetical protein
MSIDVGFTFTCRLNGRLGNQMFMIAHAYSQALDHNSKFISAKYDVPASDYFDNIYRNIDFSINYIDDLKEDESYVNIGTTFHYTPIKVPKNKNIIFHGYCQSEKFFIFNSLKIKELFSANEEFITEYFNKYPFLKDNNTIVINVRRGDYLHYPNHHPVISKEYIYKSLEYIPDYKKNPIIIISDDIEWCQENINIDNAIFITDILPWQALWLISLCKYFIISNSSFSWWGAFLGEKENSIVVCPDIWFGPEITVNTSDIYRNNWIKIPTYHQNGVLYPK